MSKIISHFSFFFFNRYIYIYIWIKRYRFPYFCSPPPKPPKSARWSFPLSVRCVYRSEVGEATGVFFVFVGDDENRLLKFVIAEFLKCDGGCDRWEDGDVWGRKTKQRRKTEDSIIFGMFPLKLAHSDENGSRLSCVPSLTGNPGGSFIWTNSRSLLKCLNGAMTSNTLSNLQAEEKESAICLKVYSKQAFAVGYRQTQSLSRNRRDIRSNCKPRRWESYHGSNFRTFYHLNMSINMYEIKTWFSTYFVFL